MDNIDFLPNIPSLVDWTAAKSLYESFHETKQKIKNKKGKKKNWKKYKWIRSLRKREDSSISRK